LQKPNTILAVGGIVVKEITCTAFLKVGGLSGFFGREPQTLTPGNLAGRKFLEKMWACLQNGRNS
jgi:hypothetical protein